MYKVENRIVDHPLYSTWDNMRGRCLTPSNKSFHNYGGRGIYICERWMTFWNFASDMGERPEGMTLERRDNNGPYSPDNCFWATRKAQARNRRDTVWLIIDGVRHSAADLAEIAGVKPDTIARRHAAGLSFDQIMAPSKDSTGKRKPIRAIKTHCKKGHEMTEENKLVRSQEDGGGFRCRECQRQRAAMNRLLARDN